MRLFVERTLRGMLAPALAGFVACTVPVDEPDPEVEGTTPAPEAFVAAEEPEPETMPMPTAYETFERFDTETWAEGSTHGKWNVVFDGYGAARIVASTTRSGRVLEARPAASRRATDTHAVLVRGLDTFTDLDVHVWMKTVSQLRRPANPWEMAWFVWGYTDNAHFYYVILKPNGWELGKRDPAYPGGQRFLATGGSPTYPPGAWHVVRVRQTDATMSVFADGLELTTFTDRERPYTSGTLALYTEDAVVRFGEIVTDSGSVARPHAQRVDHRGFIQTVTASR